MEKNKDGGKRGWEILHREVGNYHLQFIGCS